MSNKKTKKQGIVAIFDLDGTLIDSKKKLGMDVTQALAKCGVTVSPNEVTYDWYNFAASKGVPREKFEKAFNQRKTWAKALEDGEAPLFEDVHPTLEALNSAGVTLSALTRSNQKYTSLKLSHHNLKKYFEDRVAITPFDAKRNKDQEAIDLIRSLNLGTINRVYLIGDSPEDVIADKAVHEAFDIETHGIHIYRNDGNYKVPKEINAVKHNHQRYHVNSLTQILNIILNGEDI